MHSTGNQNELLPKTQIAKPTRKFAKTDHEAAIAYGKRGWVGVNGKRYAKREDWEQSIRYAGVRTL